MKKGPTTFLKTDVSTLTRTAISKIAKETIMFCSSALGVNVSKPLPSVSVIKRGRSSRYGEYDYVKNKITIYYNICVDVRTMIKTIIHEYTHYTQNIEGLYFKMLEKYGYDAHPQEIESRMNEILYYSDCWNHIKNRIYV